MFCKRFEQDFTQFGNSWFSEITFYGLMQASHTSHSKEMLVNSGVTVNSTTTHKDTNASKHNVNTYIRNLERTLHAKYVYKQGDSVNAFCQMA